MHNLLKIGGEGGDRTHGPVARTAVFETNHSQSLMLNKPSVKATKSLIEARNSHFWLLHLGALGVR